MCLIVYNVIMKDTHNYLIADCHCDTLWLFDQQDYFFENHNSAAHLDLPKLQKGKVFLQFFAVCVATEKYKNRRLSEALKFINYYHRCLEKNKDTLLEVKSVEDLALARQSNKIACLLALEGAEPLEDNIELLEIFFRMGVRSVSLTWNRRNQFADGCSEEMAQGGVTQAGQELISRLSSLGMVLDLAHLSESSFYKALEYSSKPPLVSHANARELCPHPRNLSDSQLKSIGEKEGVVGLTFYPPFITGENKATLDQLADHFIHTALVAGVEHIAIGSDYDGIEAVVEGLEDASCYGALIEILSRRGFAYDEIEGIVSGNILRLLKENLPKGALWA